MAYAICFDQIYYRDNYGRLRRLNPKVAWYVCDSQVNTRAKFSIKRLTTPIGSGKLFDSDDIANAWFEDNRNNVKALLNELFDYNSVRIVEVDTYPKAQRLLSFGGRFVLTEEVFTGTDEEEESAYQRYWNTVDPDVTSDTWIKNFKEEYTDIYKQAISAYSSATKDYSYYISDTAYNVYGNASTGIRSLHRIVSTESDMINQSEFWKYFDELNAYYVISLEFKNADPWMLARRNYNGSYQLYLVTDTGHALQYSTELAAKSYYQTNKSAISSMCMSTYEYEISGYKIVRIERSETI